MVSGVVALGWVLGRTVWTYIAFRGGSPAGLTEVCAVTSEKINVNAPPAPEFTLPRMRTIAQPKAREP